MKSKRSNWIRVAILVFFILLAVAVDWPGGIHVQVPKPKITFEKKAPFVHVQKNGNLIDFSKDFNINEGLDLQGGSHLVYTVDMSQIEESERSDALASLQKVIENRVNAFGVSEPVIYTGRGGNEYRLTVELAGVKDTEAAMNLIGKTAKLDFRELNSDSTDFQATDLSGSDLVRATVAFDQTTNEPYISIEFNSEGAEKFREITARNIGKPVGIYLDDSLISYPNVSQEISGGKAQITGDFTYTEARNLAIQLDAGRLPMPITIAEQRVVEATLGQESIHKSIVAGVIGIIAVILFMLYYYRILGIFSAIGLGLYLLFTLALFKIFGVTLTMGGIAGLILSIGSSMETDVLVFERIREELRNSCDFARAALLGFNRAWASIRDSNAVTLITCALLIWAGGTVRGFAITLALGTLVGLVTTFSGTKVMVDLIKNRKFTRKLALFNVRAEERQSK